MLRRWGTRFVEGWSGVEVVTPNVKVYSEPFLVYRFDRVTRFKLLANPNGVGTVVTLFSTGTNRRRGSRSGSSLSVCYLYGGVF